MVENLLLGLLAGVILCSAASFIIFRIYKNNMQNDLSRMVQEKTYMENQNTDNLLKMKVVEDELKKVREMYLQAEKSLSAERIVSATVSEIKIQIEEKNERINLLENQITSLQRTKEDLQQELAKLMTKEAEFEEKKRILQDAEEKLVNVFKSIGGEVLKISNEEFLKLASERFKQLNVESQGDLEKKQQAIENLVKPISDSLKLSQEYFVKMEKERVQAYGAIQEQIKMMHDDSKNLRNETNKLVNVLKRPEARGRWGEITLKRVVELSEMTEHIDYVEQETIQGEEGKLRPDMIVTMPCNNKIAIDAKAPMDAYLKISETSNPDEQRELLKSHVQAIRSHINKLSQKAYCEHITPTPQFVIMFMPGEAYYFAAIQEDINLIEDAINKKILLATPITLVGLLKTISLGWRQEQLAENAKEISEAGKKLHDAINIFCNHLLGMQKNLKSSVEKFNDMIGSLQRTVLPSARKMVELGVKPREDLKEIDFIEVTPRTPAINESLKKNESEII